ncbi:MAG TPA: sigma-70 family RNA polymerase sigma factor [Anaerolineaceae bacterium]
MIANPESVWLDKARRGDEDAFAHLVEVYQRPVFNLCYRMTGDPLEAEDAAQETFLRAYQNMQRYDPQRSFITWLLSIAAHYCIDQIRRRRALLTPLDALPEETLPDSDPGPEKLASRKEEQRLIKSILDQLGPQDRAAVVLRYWYDFSDEEIGQSLSLTVSAVKSRLHRARREMAKLWMEKQPQPAPIL